MLGLMLAHRLAQRGQQVTVLEAAPEIGGLASAWQLGSVTRDRHYHVTLLSDLRLRALLRELGLEDDMRWVETRTGFYTDGRLHSMSNTLEFLRFPPLRLIDKLRLGFTIFKASRIKEWKPLEQTLVGDWLRKQSGERTFRKIWQPLLQAKLGACYRQTSAAFIWATIARMYAARRSGMKKEMFGYVPGGYARVLERFGEVLQSEGVELRTGCRVSSVAAEPDGQVLVQSNRGSRWFDRVVLTAPSPVIAQLCPQLGEEERLRHEGIQYLGILCAAVLLKRPLANVYVTNITDGGVPFTAVIEMTTLVDPTELGGDHLVYLPRYASADDEAWNWSDHEIEERFLATLGRMYPHFRRDDVKAFRVSRVKHVMALPTLRYSERLPPLATEAANIFAVNSAHIVKGTLNVNEVLELADEAFESALGPAISAPIGSSSIRIDGAEWLRVAKPTGSHDQAAGELVARSR
jgi:protoporphyrinogen oxidase